MEKDVPQLVSKEVREGVERLTRDRVAVALALLQMPICHSPLEVRSGVNVAVRANDTLLHSLA